MLVDERAEAATIAATIDATIDGAFDGLGRRMRAHGGASFEQLSDAMRRAAAGGKRFRPRLVVGAFRALGGDPAACPALLPVAAVFELLHTAFVIHDDVIDGDTVRRGVPNVGGEFRLRASDGGAGAAGAAALGDAAAILAGDLLLHEAQRGLALADLEPGVRARLFALFDDAVLVSAAGELADVEQSVTAAPEFDAALATSRDKTAEYSFSAPLRAGAALAGADEQTDAALARCGTRLGLAFQLVDDLIGAFGTAAQAGRMPGADLAASKRTPLVALARESSTWPAVDRALALAPTGPIAVRSAQRALRDSGAGARVEDLVAGLLDDARADAVALPGGLPALIGELADAVAGRMP